MTQKYGGCARIGLPVHVGKLTFKNRFRRDDVYGGGHVHGLAEMAVLEPKILQPSRQPETKVQIVESAGGIVSSNRALCVVVSGVARGFKAQPIGGGDAIACG
jgi:hypothetical protein